MRGIVRAVRGAALALLPGRRGLGPHLDDVQRRMERLHAEVFASRDVAEAFPRATEWLLDNEYLTRRALRSVREAVPPGFYHRLPKAPEAGDGGELRVHLLAREFAGGGGWDLDVERLTRFVEERQDVGPLTMGELWALPALLRLAVLERLVVAGETLLAAGVDERVGAAAREIPRCVESLRRLDEIDWKRFFESVSRVERELRRDPAGAYGGMEFSTRDRYRKVVESLGADDGEAELQVARTAVTLASDADGTPPKRRHVGFYLVDPRGRRVLEAETGRRPGLRLRWERWLRRHAGTVYFGALGTGTAFLLAFVLHVARGAAAPGATELILVGAAASLPALAVAVAGVNWLVGQAVRPRPLPKLDPEEGLPAGERAAVCVPCLLSDADEVDGLLERLEIAYQGNPDPRLTFVLLSDWTDADARRVPGDAQLLRRTRAGVGRLNRQYGGEERCPFLLLHREREWNPSEGRWMGWERKRGKLHQFNQLLLTGSDAPFRVEAGRLTAVDGVRYVVTLDADTRLPPGGALRLVAAMAHPLNEAEFDDADEVKAGYTVLQPRLETAPTGERRSLFHYLYQGERGLDLYTHAVSDVYQDLFGEGIYAGKGVYDVAAFERSLAGRAPENALLSHDLFEGLCGRAGLLTDVEVYEEYPSHVLGYMRRQHRWIRGDWQLVPWLLPRVPAEGGGRRRNTFSLVDRWKILDNLRRSLLAPAILAFLALMWVVAPPQAWVWLLFALGVFGMPSLLGAATATGRLARLSRRLREVTAPAWRTSWQAILRHGARTAAIEVRRWLLALALLPYEAWVSLHAAGVTLYRVYGSRRHLLEWTSAAHADRGVRRGRDAATAWREMQAAPLIAVGLGSGLAAVGSGSLPAAAPLLLVWALSPAVAHLVSRRRTRRPEPLEVAEVRRLRRLALRTWSFFEERVTADTHWLPPDHVRDGPVPRVARRTSPTNVGMYVVSAVAAHDLGYLGPVALEAILRNTLETLEDLERYRGHVLNWYDLDDLRPLPPRYVSTVDSGNLAAALLVAARALRALDGEPAAAAARVDGLLDALSDLERALAHATDGAAPWRSGGRRPPGGGFGDRSPFAAARSTLKEEMRRLRVAGGDPAARTAALRRMATAGLPRIDGDVVEALDAAEVAGRALPRPALREIRIRHRTLRRIVERGSQELDRLRPWAPVMDATPPALQELAASEPAVEAALEAIRSALDPGLALGQLPAACRTVRARLRRLEVLQGEDTPAGLREWTRRLEDALERGEEAARELGEGAAGAADAMERLVGEMDFAFLYDPLRELFHIGYLVTEGAADPHHYDLLASEVRIASLLGIALGEVPPEHWLHLGRPFTAHRGEPALLSWGGTMFEYLLPAVFQRTTAETLLEQSCRVAVRRQREYGRDQRVPWGISESGFAPEHGAGPEYGYRAFGVPALALKRETDERLVVTSYASLLALDVAPRDVLVNVDELAELGLWGDYGLYEAIDFGRPELRDGAGSPGAADRVVRSYMAHHQGMILAAIDNHLNDGVLRRRFHGDPRVEAVEYLLQERVPWQIAVRKGWRAGGPRPRPETASRPVAPWEVAVPGAGPGLHLISNGRLRVVLTPAGVTGSSWEDWLLTPWPGDPTLETGGGRLLFRGGGEAGGRGDEAPGARPWPVTVGEDGPEEAVFAPHMAEFRRRWGDVESWTRVTVAPETDVAIHRVTLTNTGNQTRRVGVTSYGEVALAPPGGFGRHPAFHRLFVEAEYVEGERALVYRRRPLSGAEAPLWLVHAVVGDAGAMQVRWEVDRHVFPGRAGTTDGPGAPRRRRGSDPFAPLDPVYALDLVVELAPGETRDAAFLTLAGASREELLARLADHRPLSRILSLFERARERAEEVLDDHGIPPARMPALQALFSALHRSQPGLRPAPEELARSAPRRDALWVHGVSGDLPLLLLRIHDPEDVRLAEELIRVCAYWRWAGAPVDLVLLDVEGGGYARPLRDRLADVLDPIGTAGVHLLSGEGMTGEEEAELATAARAVLDTAEGGLAGQVAALQRSPGELPGFVSVPSAPLDQRETPPLPAPAELQLRSGPGGFTEDGREYVIRVEAGRPTPAPWTNVVANPGFGFLSTERGLGCTWSGDAGANRLSPWRNDPVRDAPSEAIYLRDEETGAVWTPTPAPAGDGSPYEVRHGAGYTLYRHQSHGLAQELQVFVAPGDPVKIFRVRLRDLRDRGRRVTVTAYVEWVLGERRRRSAPHVVVDRIPEPGALLASNPFRERFAGRVAFLAASRTAHGFTTDRTEFLGRGGDPRRPAALDRIGLSDRVETGRDPCAAYQVHVDVAPGGETKLHFVLGEGESRERAVELARRYATDAAAEEAWTGARRGWEERLGTFTVATPDPALDLMVNRWLPYQTLSSRLWGRTAAYQASGAFGFRDQLQDVTALLASDPELARAHILEAARRQFEEGDVLHWWLSETLTGVRTRCSDDLLWLPFVTAEYVTWTGDEAVLDERIAFLAADELAADEEERYAWYGTGEETGTLLEHCLRALERGLTRGPRGLPLIGTGDWNDGLDRVGREGRGESVWLGWFLYAVIDGFLPLLEERRPNAAARWRREAEELRERIEGEAWDGSWYRRAYYDDGHPLGSSQNREARIDAISQAWAVLSGGAAPDRARGAMDAVRRHLVRSDEELVLLLAPPFDRTPRDPGYIKGYPPGVRENGGQYAHAAAWVGLAFAELGDAEEAYAAFRSVNPAERATRPEGVDRYRVEPYVTAADVYGASPHVGRGGWTWYTGSAAWARRLAVEGILGIRRRGGWVNLRPRLPRGWEGYDVRWKLPGGGSWRLRVERPSGEGHEIRSVRVDGQRLEASGPAVTVPLADDGADHRVVLEVGEADEGPAPHPGGGDRRPGSGALR